MTFFRALFISLLASNFAEAGTITFGNFETILVSSPDIVSISPGAQINPPELNSRINLDSSEIVLSNPEISLIMATNVFVEGNLFIDYSVFSETQDFILNSNISLNATSITIFSHEMMATTPDITTARLILTPGTFLYSFDDILLFSGSPVSSGTFEATGNIYIGNYADLRPVPLPGAFILFFSGLGFFGIFSRKNALS